MIGILSILIIMGGMLFVRHIMSNAKNKLSNEYKAKLLDIISSDQKIFFYIIFIFILLIAFIQSSSFIFALMTDVLMILLAFLGISKQIITYRKLKNFDFPSAYLKSYKFSCLIIFSSVVLMIIVNLFPVFADIINVHGSRTNSLSYTCPDASRMKKLLSSSKAGETFVKKDSLNQDWLINANIKLED